MVVDDNQNVLEIVREMAENASYAVTSASGGQMSLNLVRRQSIPLNLVITDVMPDLDGVELAYQFQGLCPETKIIFMSAIGGDSLASAEIGLRQISCRSLLPGPHWLKKFGRSCRVDYVSRDSRKQFWRVYFWDKDTFESS